MEYMTNDNLEKKVGNVKSPESRDGFSESSGEVEDEILGKVYNGIDKVEDGDREIKSTLQGAGGSLEAVETKRKSEEIVEEAEKAGNIMEDGIDEITGNVKDDAGSAEEEIEKDKQDYESETTKRINAWHEEKDYNKKREEMERYKRGLIEEAKTIEGDIEDLKKELKENIGKRSEAAKELIGQLNGGVEISELGMFEREEVKKAFGEVAVICKNNLNIAELKYLEEFSDAKGNFDSLMNEHKEKEINIEQLRIMADDMREAYEYLKKIKEGEEGEAQEEVRGILGRIGEAIRNDPELKKKLIAAGIIAALFAVAAGVGLGAVTVAKLLGISAAEVFVYGAGAIISGGVLLKKRKVIKEALKGGGGIAFGGACIAMSWFNEENRDRAVKGLSGLNFPSWYVAWRDILLGKENESKA